MRGRRWIAVGLVALVVPALAMPILAQVNGADSTSKIEAIVADLDGTGALASVATSGLLRVYGDGSFSVDDGGNAFTGETKNGNKDLNFSRPLTLQNGLIKTPNGLRALPVTVNANYKLDGNDITPTQLAGKSGKVEVIWTLTNRTLKTQDVSYTDAVTGKQVTSSGTTAIPISTVVTGITLADANFDQVETNGVMGRTSDNKATTVGWSAFLAPPLYPGTQKLTISAHTNGFKMSAPQISMQVGGGDQPSKLVKDSQDKGGATANTLRGYINAFGDGFGQLNTGLGAAKGGIDAIQDGLDNPDFNAAHFAADGTLPENKSGGANFPGLLQALHLFDDGLGQVKSGLGLIRAGLSSGDLSKPGVSEALKLLQAGIGTGAGKEWDCSIPRDGVPDDFEPNDPRVGVFAGKPCDAVAGGGGFAGPTTVLAIFETYKASFGALIAGLGTVGDGL